MEQNGLTEADYQAVQNWATDERFTDRERVAIEYAERFALAHAELDDDFWERFRSQWGDQEIMDLSVLVASFLGLGRLTQVLAPEQSCPLEI